MLIIFIPHFSKNCKLFFDINTNTPQNFRINKHHFFDYNRKSVILHVYNLCNISDQKNNKNTVFSKVQTFFKNRKKDLFSLKNRSLSRGLVTPPIFDIFALLQDRYKQNENRSATKGVAIFQKPSCERFLASFEQISHENALFWHKKWLKTAKGANIPMGIWKQASTPIGMYAPCVVVGVVIVLLWGLS